MREAKEILAEQMNNANATITMAELFEMTMQCETLAQFKEAIEGCRDEADGKLASFYVLEKVEEILHIPYAIKKED